MGREAECAARVDGGRASRGKARLESDALTWSGDVRVKLLRADVLGAEASPPGWVQVRTAGVTLALHLGADAAAWARDLMHPKTRAEKLGVKAGARVSLLGVKDADLESELEASGADVSARLRRGADVVFVQIDAPAGLSRLAALRDAIAQDGAVWTLTPRGVAGLKDTDVMGAAKRAGFVDVKVVRFSETHSANKFVIPKKDRR